MIHLFIDEPGIGLTDQTERLSAADACQTTFSLQLGQRGTATFDLIIDAGDGYELTIGAPVFLYDQSDDPPATLFDDAPGLFDSAAGVFDAYGGLAPVCVYAGTIDTTKVVWQGNDGIQRVAVGCVSLEQALDSILISKGYYSNAPEPDNWNCGKIMLDLWNYFAGGVPIGLGAIQAGEDVTSIIFDQTPLSSCLDQLAQLSGFIWYVNPQDQLLYFGLPNEAAAPFTLGNIPLVETLELDGTRQDYRNRQTVRFAASAAQSSLSAFMVGSVPLGPELMLYWEPLAIGTAILSYDTLASFDATFTGIPVDGDTLTVNSGRVYTWKSALDNTLQDQILIGATPSACAQNLADALDAEPYTAGLGFSLPTRENSDLTAWWHGVTSIGLRPLALSASPIVTVYAKVKGTAGNGGFATTTSSAYTFSNIGVLAGGTGDGTGDVTLTATQGDAATAAPAKTMIWTAGFVQVTIPSDPATFQNLYVSFRRLGADCVSVEDTAGVAARAAIEHGTGKYQLAVADTSNGNYQSAYAEALADLEAYDKIPLTFQFQTDLPFLTPGQNLVISITRPDGIASKISGTWLVRQVDGALVPGFADQTKGHWRYTVYVINQTAIVNYISFWTSLAGGASSVTTGGSAGTSGGGGSSGPNILSGGDSVAPGNVNIVQHAGSSTGAGSAASVTTAAAPGPNMVVVALMANHIGPTQSGISAAVTDSVGTSYTQVAFEGATHSGYHSPVAIFYGFPSATVPITITGTFVLSSGASAQTVIAYAEIAGVLGIDTYGVSPYGAIHETLVTAGPDVVFVAYASGGTSLGGTTQPPLNLLDAPQYFSALITGYEVLGTAVPTPGTSFFFSTPDAGQGIVIAVAFQIPAGTFNPGKDGDFYMDLTRNRLYGPRAIGAWPVKGWPLGVPS